MNDPPRNATRAEQNGDFPLIAGELRIRARIFGDKGAAWQNLARRAASLRQGKKRPPLAEAEAVDEPERRTHATSIFGAPALAV
jgi:hypothetical protein